VLLAALDRGTPPCWSPAAPLWRVPFFYYVPCIRPHPLAAAAVFAGRSFGRPRPYVFEIHLTWLHYLVFVSAVPAGACVLLPGVYMYGQWWSSVRLLYPQRCKWFPSLSGFELTWCLSTSSPGNQRTRGL